MNGLVCEYCGAPITKHSYCKRCRDLVYISNNKKCRGCVNYDRKGQTCLGIGKTIRGIKKGECPLDKWGRHARMKRYKEHNARVRMGA